MKYKAKSLLLFIVILFSISTAKSQSIFIQNMTIVPSYPTHIDSVLLIVEATFPSGPCNQVVLYPTIIGNFISIQAGHNLGPLLYICTSIDTIQLGILAPAMYDLQYNIVSGPAQVSDSISFIVSATPGIQNPGNKHISAYFNSYSNQIIVNSKINKIHSIKLQNSTGQLLKYFTFLDLRNDFNFEVNDIADGIYILQIEMESQTLSSKLLIQH